MWTPADDAFAVFLEQVDRDKVMRERFPPVKQVLPERFFGPNHEFGASVGQVLSDWFHAGERPAMYWGCHEDLQDALRAFRMSVPANRWSRAERRLVRKVKHVLSLMGVGYAVE